MRIIRTVSIAEAVVMVVVVVVTANPGRSQSTCVLIVAPKLHAPKFLHKRVRLVRKTDLCQMRPSLMSQKRILHPRMTNRSLMTIHAILRTWTWRYVIGAVYSCVLAAACSGHLHGKPYEKSAFGCFARRNSRAAQVSI
ncbi:unnamed protein product, partial [Echinostoma caproni]|uniref:Secreted protein n=1 Tax=Echinostoma caproni TaxID=27848 RepID=A0A183BH25_9TREM